MYGHDLTTPSTKYLTYQTIQTIAPAQWRNTCLLLLFQILTNSLLPAPLSCVKHQFPPDKNCLLFSMVSLVSDISAKLLWIQQHRDQDLDSCHPNIYRPHPIISLSLKKHTQKQALSFVARAHQILLHMYTHHIHPPHLLRPLPHFHKQQHSAHPNLNVTVHLTISSCKTDNSLFRQCTPRLPPLV